MQGVQGFKPASLLVIMLPARFQVKLPAVAANGHLHDLGGAFVNRGDPRVTPDLLHHVFTGVAVTTQGLDTGVRSQVPRLGCHVFRDGPFGVQAPFIRVDAFGSFFDVGSSSLQPHHVRDNQLVRISLFLRKRRSGLDSLGRVRNRAVECGPSSSQAERRNHQSRVSKNCLRLIQSLSFHTADEPVRVDIHIIERERCGVAQANAVLVLRLIVAETRRALFNDEPARAARRVCQNGVSISNPAIADPLFAAIDFVSNDAAVLL